MKICIPTADERGGEGQIAPHFGRAPFYAMVDTETGAVEVVRNPGCHSREHTCHHGSVLEAHGIRTIACASLGRRALAGLQAQGIEVLAAPRGASVARVAHLVRAGVLHALDPEACCGGHDGHDSEHGRHAADAN